MFVSLLLLLLLFLLLFFLLLLLVLLTTKLQSRETQQVVFLQTRRVTGCPCTGRSVLCLPISDIIGTVSHHRYSMVLAL